MIGLGVKPAGLNPLTSVNLYKKIIIPTTLYGSELWYTASQSDFNTVNKHQHKIVKNIQGFPIRTRSDMCESMLGLHPLSAEIDKRKLVFLHKIMSLPSSAISRNIFYRKLFLYLSGSPTVNTGFIPDICHLLSRYKLTHILQLHDNLPSKYMWKKQVQTSVDAREGILWRQRIESDSEFNRFKCLHISITPCIVWKSSRTSVQLKLADFIAQLWVCLPDREHSICRLCNGITEDVLCHAIAECTFTMPLRDAFLDRVHRSVTSAAYNELELSHGECLLRKMIGGMLETYMLPESEDNSLRESFICVSQCFLTYFKHF